MRELIGIGMHDYILGLKLFRVKPICLPDKGDEAKNMRIISEIPVELFVKSAVKDRKVERLFENMYVDRDQICDILIRRYREMGIYIIKPFAHAQHIEADLIEAIRTLPEIQAMAQKARKSAALKAASRKHED